DRMRRHARRRTTLTPEPIEAMTSDQNPEEDVTRAQRRAEIDHALSKLPRAARVVLESAFYEGSTYSEVSATLGVPLGTVKSRATRAFAQLRSELAREDRADRCEAA